MSSLIVYIDRSAIRVGKLEEVREALRGLVEFVDSAEPQLLAYGFYIDEDGEGLTVVAIHPDSSSLEFHLEVGRDAFRTFTELIDLRTIDVYGRASEKVRGQLQQKVELLGENGKVVVHEQHAGFARFASPVT
jgi:hypothetical protein